MVPLRFSDENVQLPETVDRSSAGYSRVARVEGLSVGAVYLGTWRKTFMILNKVLSHGVAVWGDRMPTAHGVADRFGDTLLVSELGSGVHMTFEGYSSLVFRRPRYGWRAKSRQVVIGWNDESWYYRATPPFSTSIFRADGQMIARFYPWRTVVDPMISWVEVVAVLTVIAHRMWQRVTLPFAMLWNANLPRGGGDRWVV